MVCSVYYAHLEKGCTNERLLFIDGGCAEHVTGAQIQRDMLNHIRQEFEVIDVADKVKSIHLCETHKYILSRGAEWKRSVLNDDDD